MMSKRMARIAAATVAVLSLGACSPEWHIQQIFGAASPEATRVAHCESRLDPNAVSPGGGNHGLFQINNVHQRTFTEVTGRPWSERYNPHWNTVFAKHLYDTQGWVPWTCKP